MVLFEGILLFFCLYNGRNQSNHRPRHRRPCRPKSLGGNISNRTKPTRYVYLVFAFVAIAMVIGFLQSRTDGDLLRRLGRLLSHQVEPAALGKFLAGEMAADVRMAAADGPQSGPITPTIIFCFTCCRYRFCGSLSR